MKVYLLNAEICTQDWISLTARLRKTFCCWPAQSLTHRYSEQLGLKSGRDSSTIGASSSYKEESVWVDDLTSALPYQQPPRAIRPSAPPSDLSPTINPSYFRRRCLSLMTRAFTVPAGSFGGVVSEASVWPCLSSCIRQRADSVVAWIRQLCDII